MKRIKDRKRLTIIAIILSIISTVIIGEGLLHVPLWIYQINNENAPVVNNSTDKIVVYSKLSTNEIVSNIHRNDFDGIIKFTDIRFLRETPRGYYAIIQASDKRKIICLFCFSLRMKSYIVVPDGFVEREQAESDILEFYWSSKENEYITTLPHQEMNTGAAYITFYYRDGIDIVLYNVENEGIKIPDKENYLYTASRIYSLSYMDLLLNPKYWFGPKNELGYILKKDRECHGDG